MAAALGIRDRAHQPLSRTIPDDLKQKRLLLVLDNCEHLIAACAALAADLIRACPGVHVLASSREPLGVPGEQTYRVPSLTLPDPKVVPAVSVLTQYEAVRLFIDRARSVQTTFSVTDGNAPAVAPGLLAAGRHSVGDRTGGSARALAHGGRSQCALG